MSREVITDWEQREFVASIEDALVKIVDFLNRFDKACRFKLASVNARLSGLERKLDYVQHCLSQADPTHRNGQLYSIKGTMFDMKHQLEDVRRRLEERNRQMRTQLPMLMEENSNLKGMVSLEKAREEAAQIRRQATKAMIQEQDLAESPAPAPVAKPAPKPAPAAAPANAPSSQPAAQPKPKPASKPPSKPAGPPGGPPSGPPMQPPAATPPVRGPPAGPGSGPPPQSNIGAPTLPPKKPMTAPPGGPPAAPPGGPPGGPPSPPPNWGRGTELQIHILKKGPPGPKPRDGQTCIIKYVGKLSGGNRDGEVFDESPPDYEFVIGENIVGLENALKTMTCGTKAKVWIPWDMAYGEEGAEPMIPPKANLEFNLVLEKIL